MDFTGTMMEALDMQAVELTPDRVVFTMPVGPKTRQPMGYLHGGASVALAETTASIGTLLHIDKETETAVGMEINANHIRVKNDGVVTAIGAPIHKGRTSMVWDIRIVDEKDKLICVSRCTMAIIKQK